MEEPEPGCSTRSSRRRKLLASVFIELGSPLQLLCWGNPRVRIWQRSGDHEREALFRVRGIVSCEVVSKALAIVNLSLYRG
jgi:hypothetical protein